MCSQQNGKNCSCGHANVFKKPADYIFIALYYLQIECSTFLRITGRHDMILQNTTVKS